MPPHYEAPRSHAMIACALLIILSALWFGLGLFVNQKPAESPKPQVIYIVASSSPATTTIIRETHIIEKHVTVYEPAPVVLIPPPPPYWYGPPF